MHPLSPHEYEQTDWPRRIALAAGVVTFVVVTYAIIYQWIMGTYEGVQVPYLQAVQVVIESLTTAGFGGHAPWESNPANAWILFMNLSGVFLVFLAIPLFATPLLREVFERRPPDSTELTDHIIVCGYSEKDEVVRRELEELGQELDREFPFLYIEPEPTLVRELIDRGVKAIVGEPARVETLRAANAEQAAAVVADVDDETNPSVILAAKVIDEDLPVLSVVRDRRVATHHEYAGADRVIKARESFGKSLAIRATSSYAQKFRNSVEIEDDVEVTELVIEEGCELIGKTLEDIELYSEKGRDANVIAAWSGGKFLLSPPPDTIIRANAILVVAGKIRTLEINRVHPIPGCTDRTERIVIGGFGTVGRTVWSALQKTGIETTVIDVRNGGTPPDYPPHEDAGPRREECIDVVGNITDRSTIERADVGNADAVVLCLDGDISTIYASILIAQVAPDVEIIARVDETESISTLYQAGADFVLSLSAVTGEILAAELLGILGEEGGFLPASTEFKFARAAGSHFAGQSLAEIDLRRQTGCTVAAVERGDKLWTDVRGDFIVEDDDVLIVAGSKEKVGDFVDDFLPRWKEANAARSESPNTDPVDADGDEAQDGTDETDGETENSAPQSSDDSGDDAVRGEDRGEPSDEPGEDDSEDERPSQKCAGEHEPE